MKVSELSDEAYRAGLIRLWANLHDKDVIMLERLLQGKSTSDLEEMFRQKIISGPGYKAVPVQYHEDEDPDN